MKLKYLLKGMNTEKISGNMESAINSICYDSRKVNIGSAFFAIKGGNHDGHLFIDEALKKGATAVFYSGSLRKETIEAHSDSTLFVKTKDTRESLSHISAYYYGEPSKKLKLIGITGTNGKTTTAYIIKSITESLGKKTGLTGTIEYMIGGKTRNASYTTPESPEFNALLNDMVSEGCEYVVSEVSSHSLSQKRVDKSHFDIALFTNLSRDHLDFHTSMEDYYTAKRRLFKELLITGGTAVINSDDRYGQRLAAEMKDYYTENRTVITYGTEDNADVKAANINRSFMDFQFDVQYNGTRYRIKPGLKGMFNVYNVLAAFTACASMQIPYKNIISGISEIKNVKGRFESVDCGQDFYVIIDYAHTDDALRNLISNARKMRNGKIEERTPPGKIITLFGCGGDRDKGKRVLMGEVATRLSDFTIITTDNPRFEDPADIIRQIESGAAGGYIVERDREKAIERALAIAKKGDIVLIAGKGHENYQEIRGVKQHFDDREVIESVLKKQGLCNC